MRLDSGRSREEILGDLRAEAERTWGPERAAALGAALELTAGALWRLASAPFDPLDSEPAFVGPSPGGEA